MKSYSEERMSSNSERLHFNPLDAPVGALMRPYEGLPAESSLLQAALVMRSQPMAVVPVHQNGVYRGVLRPQDLVEAIGAGEPMTNPVVGFVRSSPAPLMPSIRGAEALRALEASGEGALPVVDGSGLVLGVLAPSDLAGLEPPRFRPRLVGGMATPFGVYLTNGSVRAGARPWMLSVTGAILLVFFMIAQLAGTLAIPPLGLAAPWNGLASGVLAFLCFAVLMRFSPIAGYHAAEHMVVHAIERGEPLVPEVVRRMPRIHPRCGTNIAVGSILFLSIMSVEWIADLELRLLLALLVTVSFWRLLGSLTQYWITTRPPNDKQIQAGIEAGEDLLQRAAAARYMFPGVGARLWNSGMPQIMLGSMLLVAILHLLSLIPVLAPWVRLVYSSV